jgi:hypothetical protein
LLITELGGPDKPGLGQGFQQSLAGQIPGQNPLQAASLAGLERAALGDMNVFSGQVGAESQQTLIELLNATAQDSSAVFDATVAGPAQDDLKRALEELNASAVGSGNLFSSDNAKAKGFVLGDFVQGLSRERTRFAFDSETRARDTRLQALGLAPGIAGLDIDLGTQLFGAGTAARNEDFKTFAAELGLFQADQQREEFLLNLLLGGSAAPTFGVSGGFSLGGAGSADGGVLASFAEGVFR